MIAVGDFVWPDETTGFADHLDAQAFEALLAVMRGDRGDDAMNMVVDAGEIDVRLVAVDPEATRATDGVGGARRGEQGLRRHTARVQAVAAHLALLDQYRSRAHLGGARRDRQASRARADHTNVGVDDLGHD